MGGRENDRGCGAFGGPGKRSGNNETPIWLPSARVLVDTVTGLQFLFFAYPDGRLHPAQDVTHHHRGYHTRPSTMLAHGRTAPPKLR